MFNQFSQVWQVQYVLQGLKRPFPLYLVNSDIVDSMSNHWARGCSSSCREIDLFQRQLILQIVLMNQRRTNDFWRKKSMELSLCNKISSRRKLMKADEIFSAGILPQVLNLIEKIEEKNVAKKSKTTCKKGRLTIWRFNNLRTSCHWWIAFTEVA